MIDKSPLPIWNEKESRINDGAFFDAPDICSKQKIKRCKKHYEEIKLKKGFHQCHAGCSSYSTGNANEQIYTGMRVAGYYDQKKMKSSSTFLPTLPPGEVLKSISKSREHCRDQGKQDAQSIHDKDLVDFCLHEVRKYNSTIKRVSEEYLTLRDQSSANVLKLMKTIFSSGTLITNRLNMYDMESNPQIVTASSPFRGSVFSKFLKASHCLEIYGKDSEVKIPMFNGELRGHIDMYPAFDFVPHVILENAIKYSPRDREVQVSFEEEADSFDVRIESIGPKNSNVEIPHLFEKNFRGSSAKTLDASGGGYGLYFAKLICDIHNVAISATSSQDILTRLNKIPYSLFTVRLRYPK